MWGGRRGSGRRGEGEGENIISGYMKRGGRDEGVVYWFGVYMIRKGVKFVCVCGGV